MSYRNGSKTLSRLFIVRIPSSMEKEIAVKCIARALTSSLLLSYGIRRNTVLCIEYGTTVAAVHGSGMRGLYPDEGSSTGIARKIVFKKQHRGVEYLKSCNDLSGKNDFDIVIELCCDRLCLVSMNGRFLDLGTALIIVNVELDKLSTQCKHHLSSQGVWSFT